MTDAAARPRRTLARTTLLLLPAQAVFRVGEGALPLLLAAWFGRSHATDVYYFAWAVFAFAGSLVFSAYQDSALIPIVAETRKQHPDQVPLLLGSLLGHTIVFGGGLAALICASATLYFRVHYDDATFALALRMVPAFGVYLVMLSLRTYFAALLHASFRFFAQPMASGIGMAVNLGLVYVLKSSLGVAAVPFGALASESVMLLALLGFARREKLTFAITLARPEPAVRFFRLVFAEVVGGSVTRINPILDQLMAGLAGVVGGGTLLRYTFDVATFPTSLLQASLLPVLLTHLSEHFADRDAKSLEKIVVKAIAYVSLALGVVAVLLFAIRRPLLTLAFRHGEMDDVAIEAMAAILPYQLAGLVPFGALLVLARTHVAMQNSRIMLGMGILNAVSNAVFNVILVKPLGLGGIALATSLMHVVVAAMFWIRFKTKLRAMSA